MKSRIVSPKIIFIWNLLGSVSSAAISIFLLLLVTRLLTELEADIFSFAYAVANLFVIIASFQVRDYQATDVSKKFSFSQYLATRLITITIMLLLALSYIFLSQYEFQKSTCIFLICLYRGSDALSDVFQGLFQQNARLDIAGKSLFLRNSIVILTFGFGLFITNNLLLSLIYLVISSYLFVFFFDVTNLFQFTRIIKEEINLKAIKNILLECLPLFINAFLLVTIYNQPKYALNTFFERGVIGTGVQRDFNILFMPVFSMNILLILFRPMITQLAIYRRAGDYNQFKQYQKRIVKMVVGLAVLVLVGGIVLGIPALNILYGTNLNKYWLSFIITMLGGIASTFATICDNMLTVLRKQKYLVISFAISCLLSILISNPLVEYYGILGAAIAFVSSMWTWFLISLVIYLKLQKHLNWEVQE
ncbi:MATE family efflux transporter [Streptococcus suis]|uniref:polysaccharide biosynthesis C-terminal domain-containing protein n=1 Tax=Streptococcus suis TaxID=1307 RepID=UPI0005CD9A45|nr:lipopolysaccharide biosynthesis protein [Streptococcus suis]MBL1139358.1 lipopolysaccharide biosynthesis protein [Streptococcus suis]MBM6423007.1 lipopolysaccharide biosynthesis protein [Streptococcus suis]NQF95082.1 lipopolysaccharide biosynthesis protein [Streptococcus suis]NQR02450.1 lipopolysaccharide biosynthesis protein [Streptococcus suis]NQR72342.1 lipopolysaccharide biosynthesis protein [Streptococcus suis]